ncbi:uncharacterized protein LOC110629626 isoform X5 [Manihot esculenta]|uniref:uncharacterized protein LOC110629626 isoform X5 n=1 Tax=Manihot esculenta TaxID=3983 RepID=UPI000B5D3F2A|nr:uncharacterized protein LOC110629626 isoform X5 [Manihot esculenta]
MALPLGKLTILVGAGILGSVLAKEGRLSNVSDLVSGAFKIAFKQINQDDSSSSIGKPHNDSLMAQGWKLPDMMFATRRSLSDACTTIAGQLENVYASIRSTRRQLSSNIDRVDSNLNEVAVLTATTQEKVTELLEDSERIGHDVRYVRDAVETLEIKISRIEGKQDMTNLGVKKLVDYAYNLENKLLEENTQASSSSSRIAFSSERGSLLLPPSEPTSLSISIGSLEVQRPLHRAASATPPQRTNGISEAVEVSSNLGISNGFRALEETNNGSSRWIKPTRIMRTCSATNAVVPQTSSIRQQF